MLLPKLKLQNQNCFIGKVFDKNFSHYYNIIAEIKIGLSEYELFHFPESGVYPKFQKDFRKEIGNKKAIIISHSHIIASQFEPCEIFKLDFDENGGVMRVPVKENVKYLDLEGVNSELYDIEPNEPITEEGKEKLKELGNIVNQILNAKADNNLEKVKKLFPKYRELSIELQAHTFYPDYTLEKYEKNS